MSNHELIYCHPHVRDGAPCIVGTRITVREIRQSFKRHHIVGGVVGEFENQITMEEVQAALSYELTDVHHSWRGGGVDILEGEPFMYIGHSGTAKIPLDSVPTALAAMQAAYDEWQALGSPADE